MSQIQRKRIRPSNMRPSEPPVDMTRKRHMTYYSQDVGAQSKKTLEAVRRKKKVPVHKRRNVRIASDFLSATMQTRKARHDIARNNNFQV